MQTMKTYKIGDTVQRAAFTDCFGRDIPCTGDLTVISVKTISGTIPDYQRVTAVGESGTFEAAARFFF